MNFELQTMSNLIKFLAPFILIIGNQTSLNAQSNEDLYASSYANLVQEEGLVRTLFVLKDATISFPNGTNELHVLVEIPDTVINYTPRNIADSINTAYLLRLDIKIDPDQIQQELTSLKTFKTHGYLVLNKIGHDVEVDYMPIESGLEENGNFNVFISFRINPADFGLANAYSKKVYVINMYNTKVNRL